MIICHCIQTNTESCKECLNNQIIEMFEDISKNTKDIDSDYVNIVNKNFWDLI